MDNDALVASLLARIRVLEDVVARMDTKLDRGLAISVSNQQQLEQASSRLKDTARLAQLVIPEEEPEVMPPGPRHKRERHLRLVTVFAVMAAGAAEALRAALAWTAGRGVRKAVALAAGTAIAGGAVLAPHMATPGGPADPDIIRVQPLPSDSDRGPGHHHYHHSMIRTWPPVMVRRRRKTAHHEHAADHDAVPPPAPSPSPSPSPTTSPTPAPQVSVTPSPAGQVIARAPLGAFPGLAWDDIPAWRSVP